ncbi:MAG: SRPBCC family protein, partial [Solirubrobacteraceae bacterium]
MAAVGIAAAGYFLIVTGRLAPDLGWGRRLRPLGPLRVEMDADVDTVFDVIADPYLEHTPRALSSKLAVLERSESMVLADHYTPVWPRLSARTTEAVV